MVITEELLYKLAEEPYSFEIDENYEESMEVDERISETFSDEYPEFMDIQRPQQTESQKLYRKTYFEGTGNPIAGFLSEIEKQYDKVFDSTEFRVTHNDPKIERYFNKTYKNGTSIIASFKEDIKKPSLLSPNSVLFVLPEIVNGEVRPYYHIAESENVFMYRANEICVIRSEEKCDRFKETGEYVDSEGKVFYLFDTASYVVFKQDLIENNKDKWRFNATSGGGFKKHGCDFLPCKKVGRKIKDKDENGVEVRISDIYNSLSFLRNAMMDEMDRVVENSFHTASQEWTLATAQCDVCGGNGKIADKTKRKPTKCTSCGGGGKVPAFSGDGLNKMIVPMGMTDFGKSEKMPTQFGGFIERSETGAKVFNESFMRNMSFALQPFGLEHLLLTPYNQSGAAKDKDMQEGYAFIHSVSLQMQELFGMVSTAIPLMIYNGDNNAYSKVPSVAYPTVFNSTTSDSLFAKMKDADTFKMSDSLKLDLEKEYTLKSYGESSNEYRYIVLKHSFDPFPTMKISEKLGLKEVIPEVLFNKTMLSDTIINGLSNDVNFFKKSLNEQLSLCEVEVLNLLPNKV